MDLPDQEPSDTDWCVGGCTPWQETEEGRQRYRELAARNIAEREAGRPYVK